MCSRQHLCNTEKREDLVEYRCGTSQIPSEGQVRELSQLLSARAGVNYAYLDLWGFWVFYSSIDLTSAPWPRRSFLVGEIFFNSCILRNPFLVGVLSIRVERGVLDISIHTSMHEDQVRPHHTCQRFTYPLKLLPINFLFRLRIPAISFMVPPSASRWNRRLHIFVVCLQTHKQDWRVHWDRHLRFIWTSLSILQNYTYHSKTLFFSYFESTNASFPTM